VSRLWNRSSSIDMLRFEGTNEAGILLGVRAFEGVIASRLEQENARIFV